MKLMWRGINLCGASARTVPPFNVIITITIIIIFGTIRAGVAHGQKAAIIINATVRQEHAATSTYAIIRAAGQPSKLFTHHAIFFNLLSQGKTAPDNVDELAEAAIQASHIVVGLEHTDGDGVPHQQHVEQRGQIFEVQYLVQRGGVVARVVITLEPRPVDARLQEARGEEAHLLAERRASREGERFRVEGEALPQQVELGRARGVHLVRGDERLTVAAGHGVREPAPEVLLPVAGGEQQGWPDPAEIGHRLQLRLELQLDHVGDDLGGVGLAQQEQQHVQHQKDCPVERRQPVLEHGEPEQQHQQRDRQHRIPELLREGLPEAQDEGLQLTARYQHARPIERVEVQLLQRVRTVPHQPVEGERDVAPLEEPPVDVLQVGGVQLGVGGPMVDPLVGGVLPLEHDLQEAVVRSAEHALVAVQVRYERVVQGPILESVEVRELIEPLQPPTGGFAQSRQLAQPHQHQSFPQETPSATRGNAGQQEILYRSQPSRRGAKETDSTGRPARMIVQYRAQEHSAWRPFRIRGDQTTDHDHRQQKQGHNRPQETIHRNWRHR
uniref:Uncharacterized protein n=1 Tax=Anopheles atroparvus TaxID=41427 RepID=A0A182IVF4_ANOAO